MILVLLKNSFVEQVCFTLDGHSCLIVQYFNKKQGNSLAYWPRFMHSRLFEWMSFLNEWFFTWMGSNHSFNLAAKNNFL